MQRPHNVKTWITDVITFAASIILVGLFLDLPCSYVPWSGWWLLLFTRVIVRAFCCIFIIATCNYLQLNWSKNICSYQFPFALSVMKLFMWHNLPVGLRRHNIQHTTLSITAPRGVFATLCITLCIKFLYTECRVLFAMLRIAAPFVKHFHPGLIFASQLPKWSSLYWHNFILSDRPLNEFLYNFLVFMPIKHYSLMEEHALI